MMHHHQHSMQQNQIQRGDPNRRGQQTHCIIQNQQRGHPIMLGVPGSSAVPPSGVIVTMPSVPIQAIPPQQQTSVPVHQQATVQQQSTPQQVLHSQQQPHEMIEQQIQNVENNPKAQSGVSQNNSSSSSSQQQSAANSPPQQHTPTMSSGASSNVLPGTCTSAGSSVTGDNSSSTTANSCLANTKEKTPMCLINELARYNKIQHQYRLTGESGPAHKKRFIVSLKLGSEEYESEGNSIKKAQHAAAKEALVLTKLKHPPPKTSRTLRMGGKNSRGGCLTPTVELNALAMKRGELTIYSTILNQSPYIGSSVNGFNAGGFHRPNMYGQQGNRFNYDTRRYSGRGHYHGHFDNQRYPGYTGYGKPHGWHGPGNPGDTYSVTLRVGPREFTGEGATVQLARHDAAARAVKEFKQHGPTESASPSDASFTNTAANPDTGSQTSQSSPTEDPNFDLKSPISLVHEIALKRDLNVTFEVESEKGLPHMKIFVTTCKVGDMVTEGEGNGKKISKKRAAEKMLDELKKLPPMSPSANGIVRLKRKPAIPKKKTRSLIKAYQEQNEPEYTEEINPISRLLQIQQAKKEKEPIYNLLEERGVARRREFVMEVTVGQSSATGTGSNKKLAKRAAAEALLQQLGYNQPIGSQSDGKVSNVSVTVKAQTIPNEEKPRKVTFLEDQKNDSGNGHTQPQSTPSIPGGTAGRQLVPGLLLMCDQSNPTFTTTKSDVNIQTTATIAKEFLKAGNSPTADALASKSGHNIKMIQSDQNTKSSTQVRPKQQLLYLSKLLGFQVQFSDFPKANHEEFLTLLSLNTEPPQVCHGAGDSTDESHDAAALAALRRLSDMGLDNNIQLENKTENGQNGIEGVHNSSSNTSSSSQKSLTKPSILSNGVTKK